MLDCLKYYLTNVLKGAVSNFADTPVFISDQFYFKGKKDSLANILEQVRSGLPRFLKILNHCNVVMTRRKSELGKAWYVEKWIDKQGKSDSLYHTDDV